MNRTIARRAARSTADSLASSAQEPGATSLYPRSSHRLGAGRRWLGILVVASIACGGLLASPQVALADPGDPPVVDPVLGPESDPAPDSEPVEDPPAPNQDPELEPGEEAAPEPETESEAHPGVEPGAESVPESELEPASEPKTEPKPQLPPRASGSVLRIGQRVAAGGSLRSSNGYHRLTVRADGRLAVISRGKLRWKSTSARHPGAYLILTSTGMRMVHGDHTVRIGQRTHGVTNARITRAGDLVLRTKAGNVRWSLASAAPVRRNNSGPQYVSQNAGKYAGTRIGSGTLAGTGCVPAAMTMALRGYGVKVNVRDVGRVMHRKGDFNRGVAGAGSRSIVAAARQYGVSAKPLKSRKAVIRALKHRQTVVALVGGPGSVTSPGSTHAVALRGYDGGATRLYNPNSGAPQARYSLRSLWNHRSTDPMDRRAGAVFWAVG